MSLWNLPLKNAFEKILNSLDNTNDGFFGLFNTANLDSNISKQCYLNVFFYKNLSNFLFKEKVSGKIKPKSDYFKTIVLLCFLFIFG